VERKREPVQSQKKTCVRADSDEAANGLTQVPSALTAPLKLHKNRTPSMAIELKRIISSYIEYPIDLFNFFNSTNTPSLSSHMEKQILSAASMYLKQSEMNSANEPLYLSQLQQADIEKMTQIFFSLESTLNKHHHKFVDLFYQEAQKIPSGFIIVFNQFNKICSLLVRAFWSLIVHKKQDAIFLSPYLSHKIDHSKDPTKTMNQVFKLFYPRYVKTLGKFGEYFSIKSMMKNKELYFRLNLKKLHIPKDIKEIFDNKTLTLIAPIKWNKNILFHPSSLFIKIPKIDNLEPAHEENVNGLVLNEIRDYAFLYGSLFSYRKENPMTNPLEFLSYVSEYLESHDLHGSDKFENESPGNLFSEISKIETKAKNNYIHYLEKFVRAHKNSKKRKRDENDNERDGSHKHRKFEELK